MWFELIWYIFEITWFDLIWRLSKITWFGLTFFSCDLIKFELWMRFLIKSWIRAKPMAPMERDRWELSIGAIIVYESFILPCLWLDSDYIRKIMIWFDRIWFDPEIMPHDLIWFDASEHFHDSIVEVHFLWISLDFRFRNYSGFFSLAYWRQD